MTNQNELSSACHATVVVPCYNEAKRLDMSAFRNFLSGSDSVRLVFVDDGSKDNTVEVLQKTCAGFNSRIDILRCPVNVGKAEAVRCGLVHAICEFQQQIVGYWDADLATPLDAIPRFLKILDGHPEIDMVFGARVRLLGRHVNRHFSRHYLGRIFATIVSQVLRLPIYDTQCGAKLFRVQSGIGDIVQQPFLSRWIFDVEIIARYILYHGSNPAIVQQAIYEYPLERWDDVAGSKVRARDFFIAIADVLKIRLKYL